jgi:periplasmic protein TonB
MALRCLLFSSNEEVRPPIWQVLAELGIDGEYCPGAVDAVERVTTQLFQIVITDWEDQPEAAFLLKTARDLKAAQRPLTLAIVGDEAKVPEALRAGANSVLLKPIRVEQVRDTMSTACQLLRSKQSFNAPAAVAASPETPPTAAVSKPVSGSAAAATAPARVTESSEKAFRAGEFLVSSAPAPSAQFDTESEVRPDQAGPVEVEALTELEPMASAVEAQPAESAEPQTPLTGWAALQERLTRSGAQKLGEPPKNELLTYGEISAPGQPRLVVSQDTNSEPEKPAETRAEAALFAYMEGEALAETAPPRKSPKIGKILCAGIATACLAMIAIPQTRQRFQANYRNSVRLGKNWLNPQPVPVPQVTPQHETFTSDDEYRLPVAPNIPDATTDPSQIRVIPVIDPTAKPKNNADGGSVAQTTSDGGAADQNQSSPDDSGQAPAVDGSVKPQASPNLANAAPTPSVAAIVPPAVPQPKPQPSAPAPAPATVSPQQVPAAPGTAPSTPSNVPAPASAAIPPSLRSQLAPATPDASGAKPVEAAMSAIEPVNLPELAAWGLLAQKVEPTYPDAAKGAGQRGSVALQVLIGRDGTVQDAKFLQGSLIFARAAIDAVKQWRFKPYLLNGQPVSVQTVITLNFKPSA